MNKLYVSTLIILLALAARGQVSPGFTQTPDFAAPCLSLTGGGPQPLLRPENTPITQTSSAIAEAITPDIQSLAANLGYDPTSIYNYVHDQIRYVHYFGSKKGAELTLLERSGNDFDQCALLSALLQASGYLPTYQFGVMEMPYDSPNHQDLHHWLGLSLLNTNFETNTLSYFSNFFGTRGNYIWGQIDATNTIGFQRVWLNLKIGSTNYYLDPSFKISEPIAGLSNLPSAMGLSSNTLWTTSGGTDTGTYVSGLNEGALRGALQACNSNLSIYLSNNYPNATVSQVIGGQQIISSSGLPLATNLLFPIFTNNTYPLLNWTNQPTNFMGTFSIAFDGTNKTWYTPQLTGQRVSLTFSNNGVAQLWIEDTPILQANNVGGSSTLQVVMTASHPYGNWNTSLSIPIDVGSAGIWDQSFTNTYQATNASYNVVYGFDANQAWLKERQQKLNAYLAAGYTNGSRQVTTETLNVMGLSWMVQTELVHELLCQEAIQIPEWHHRFGRMAQEIGRGYYVDVYLQLNDTLPGSGHTSVDSLTNNQVFDLSSYFYSAMEHGIIEQLQDSNLVAASTVKMIEIASTNSQDIYLANSGNWSTVQSSLVNYGSTISTLDAAISAGFTLLLPQNGSNNVAGPGTWAGSAYVELGATSLGREMGMVIGGGYNGGFVSNPNETVNTTFVDQTINADPTFFNPQSATLPVPAQLGADPINMVDGTFQINSTDLTLGQTEPRGLNFARYYSSERINYNPAGVGPGWLHSYYCNATAISDPEDALGDGTVAQMTPMIVATYAAFNFYNDVAPDPKNWTVTALIAKWGIDQLINNAVTINLGNSTIQFSRQPNGSYSPPANSTMTLSEVGNGFSLQERHGRTFSFNTNGALTNIVDPYGQSMTLSYNSNNLVTNVTDCVGRSLSFNYTGSQLTSVSDSAGRSISYSYAGGQLTSYTDPQGSATTYAYDTNNELTATYDALNRLVVTNFCDGSGHITSQLTLGNTNELWQIQASGYQTAVIDPAGDQTVYTYDSQSRPIAVQDGMGNVTQTVYDGQNHVIETITPLGETNQFIYDGNNNLIVSIDPLGYSNVFTYDSNYNLITSIDAKGNTSHFGYNAQFSLTGSTNGNGDWKVYTYNSDGTLASREDSDGTTTYGYDSYGQVNSITYPDGLGSESFVNNAFGDPTSHTDANDFTSTFAYNLRRQLTNEVAPTNVTVTLSYDAVGNLSKTVDARGFTSSNSWSVTRKLLSTTLPSTPQGSPVMTQTYDVRDWLASTQNPLGKTTYYTNDAAQRLIAATDPMQRTTVLSYDQDSHPVTSTDAAGDLTTQFWDARGKMIKVIDAATNIVGKAYDAANNLVFLTNRNGKVWQFQYDGANRLTNTVSPLGHTSSQFYGNDGLIEETVDPLLRTASFSYDGLGRVSTKWDDAGINDYAYDGNHNLTSIFEYEEPSWIASVFWTYDAYNRVTSYTDAAGDVIQYRYDANGNMTNLVYPGGRTVIYRYDGNNRLTNVTDWAGRQTGYTYDLAGHVTSVSRPNNTVCTMGYDNDGELTNIVEQTTTKFPICFYTLNYNNAGRVQWEFKGPLPHTNTPATRTMTYDNDNRLATFNGTAVTIDANGNLTHGPGTNNTFITYGYNARNELMNAGGLSYHYDGTGNRLSMTNGAEVTSFVTSPQGSQTLMRIQNGTTNYYVYGNGLLYESDETATTTNVAFYHFDCRGSTVALTDTNGNITDQVEYSPYGTTTYRFGTNNTPFLYNGQFGVQTDPNGLLYMRARYYNPYISRFINADPSGFNGGLNFYAFCNNNPISLTDPFGLGAEANSSGYSWIGQVNSANAPFLPSGPFQYVTGTGAASDLLSGAANTGAAVGNIGANVLGGAATVINGANQFANYLLNPFGWDMQAVAAAFPIVGAEESLATEAGSLAAEETAEVVGEAAQTGGRAPNFIVSEGGTAYPVPEGATGPFPAESGKGFQFTGGSRGNGLSPNATDFRFMDPVTTGTYQYPGGYGSYGNAVGQTINPLTGQTIAPSNPWWHIPAQ